MALSTCLEDKIYKMPSVEYEWIQLLEAFPRLAFALRDTAHRGTVGGDLDGVSVPKCEAECLSEASDNIATPRSMGIPCSKYKSIVE